MQSRIAAARAAVANSDSPTPYLDLAQSLVTLHRRTGQGSLDDVISAARKARELWPQSPEHRERSRAKQGALLMAFGPLSNDEMEHAQP